MYSVPYIMVIMFLAERIFNSIRVIRVTKKELPHDMEYSFFYLLLLLYFIIITRCVWAGEAT